MRKEFDRPPKKEILLQVQELVLQEKLSPKLNSVLKEER